MGQAYSQIISGDETKNVHQGHRVMGELQPVCGAALGTPDLISPLPLLDSLVIP